MARYIRVFLCSGNPNVGKTTWTYHYRECNENVQRYCLDTFFRDPEYEEVGGFVRNIKRHCSKEWNEERYIEVAKRILQEGLNKAEGIVDVVIEGYVLKSVENQLTEFLLDYGCDEVIPLRFNKFSFLYQNKIIDFKAQNCTIKEACVSSFKEMRRLNFNQFKRGINYQSFPEFNHKANSRTTEKLSLANIELSEGQSFLDIGCNNGFFCFWAAKKHLAEYLE